MQFNSYVFIFLSMPILILAYFLLGKFNTLLGKIVIVAGSMLFYTYNDAKVFLTLAISLIVNFLFSKLIERKQWNKRFIAIPIIVNIGLLLYFKYTNFAIANVNAWFGKNISLKEIILPVGISFFTFQQIAYIVAICRKEIPSAKLIDYMAYILYFPKLLMGPLMDPVDFIEQFNDSKLKKIDWNNIACGLKIFSLGLLKKVLLADTFAKAVSWGFTNIKVATSMDWILVMLFYTFEIYFDFSGYSDMAVGSSLMLNITLPINFDSPYKALSIRDFWKRWHISLTKFLTKYIYIPLGGSRKGLFFTCLNTMVVFCVSGIWHGANYTFILWGVLHGFFSILDRLMEKFQKNIFEPVSWLVTFFIVNVLWLLFRADSISQWLDILHTIFAFQNTIVNENLIKLFTLPEGNILFDMIPELGKIHSGVRGFDILLFIIISSIVCFVSENNYKNLRKLSFASLIFAAIAFVWGVTCLGSESVFVYFNF